MKQTLMHNGKESAAWNFRISELVSARIPGPPPTPPGLLTKILRALLVLHYTWPSMKRKKVIKQDAKGGHWEYFKINFNPGAFHEYVFISRFHTRTARAHIYTLHSYGLQTAVSKRLIRTPNPINPHVLEII